MPRHTERSRSIDGDGAFRAGAVAPPSVTARSDGDRVLVAVRGELCLDDCDMLERTLRTALAGSAGAVDLDLGALDCWDCSALNVLLTMRRQALAAGKTLTVISAGTAAERLMALTDTQALFTPAGTSGPSAEPEPVSEPTEDGSGLRAELVQLRRAMQTRPEIDLARGILMASFRLSTDEAWDVLVMASQNTNTKLHRLATNVVGAIDGTPLPDPVQRHLTTAVVTITAAGNRRRRRSGASPGRL
ncbi:ANTAR domain-containing protein [Streptomyces sp. YIM S03343]